MSSFIKKINLSIIEALGKTFNKDDYFFNKIIAYNVLLSFSLLIAYKFKIDPKFITYANNCLIVGVFISIISFFKKDINSTLYYNFVNSCLLFFVPKLNPIQLKYYTIGLLVTYIVQTRGSSVYYLLHLILPNRRKRIDKIKYHQYNQQRDRDLRYNYRHKSINIPNLIQNDIVSFLKKYFKRQEKSLIRFFAERTTDDQDLLALQTWSLMIPKNNLSLDLIKTLLGRNPIDLSLMYYTLYHHNITEKQALIDDLFSNYNEQQLRRIFTTRFSVLDYKNILEIKFNYPDLKLPIYGKFSEANIYAKFFEDTKTGTNEIPYNNKFNAINDFKYENYEFKVLKSSLDLYTWAKSLNNCLASYKNKQTGLQNITLIGIYKDQQPYACIEYFLTTPGQCKLSLNEELDDSEKTKLILIINQKIK